MTTLTGQSLIGGRPQTEASGGRRFHAVDPASGAPLEPAYVTATAEQVDWAVRAARDAFELYREIPNERRGRFLRAIAKSIEELGQPLLQRVHQETALPKARIESETTRTAHQLRLFAALVEDGSWVDARIDPALPDRKPLPRPDIRSMLRPLGPVAVFGPSNFPLAFGVAGGDTASALAAGCPVVAKAHPAQPGTSEMIGRAVQAAAEAEGMPDGIFSVLFDSGHDVGVALVQHPLIQAVGFTGSLQGGRALFNLAAARKEPIPVYAEMGSVNPVYLLPGALATRSDEIAAGLHQSATMGVGQFCTNPGIVLYDGQKPFEERLVRLFEQTPAAPMLTADIAAGYAEGVSRLGTHPAVRTLAATSPESGPSAAGACLMGIDAEALLAEPALAYEVFGPASILVRYGSMNDLAAIARMLPGQLTASIHGTEEDLAQAVELLSVLEMRVGRLVFNGFPTGVEVGHAMVHGGPYPATTDSRSTSVGTRAILRFARPVGYQDFPDAALPDALRSDNPLRIRRLVDGRPE